MGVISWTFIIDCLRCPEEDYSHIKGSQARLQWLQEQQNKLGDIMQLLRISVHLLPNILLAS